MLNWRGPGRATSNNFRNQSSRRSQEAFYNQKRRYSVLGYDCLAHYERSARITVSVTFPASVSGSSARPLMQSSAVEAVCLWRAS